MVVEEAPDVVSVSVSLRINLTAVEKSYWTWMRV